MDRLVDRLEAHCLLREPRYRQHPAHRTRRQDEHVVVEVDGRALEEMDARPMGGVIDRLHLADDEPGAPQHASQRDDDVTGLDRARRRLGQEGLVLEVVLRVHENDLVVGATEAALEPQRGVRTDEAAPADEDPHIVKGFTRVLAGQPTPLRAQRDH